jgi:hypothetical protein
MTNTITQTPSELLDYDIDWAARGLGIDTIATSTWSQDSTDYTISNTSHTDTMTTFWLTHGDPGTTYFITNTITTVGGQTMQETIAYTCVAQRFIR